MSKAIKKISTLTMMERSIRKTTGREKGSQLSLIHILHRFSLGRKLVLGGVEVAFEQGLAGHSDADVLVHAIIDAMLGAAGLGDIGEYFPPGEAKYKDISSTLLLERVKELIGEKGYCIHNLDCVIMAEVPHLSPYKAKRCV